MGTPAMRRRRAFTLIELLVVMTVISILAGVLLPVLHKAREEARKTTCANNLQQIGYHITEYTEDYRGWLPQIHLLSPVEPTNLVSKPPVGRVGIGLLAPFDADDVTLQKIQHVAICPGTNHWDETTLAPFDDDEAHCSYLYRGAGAAYTRDGDPHLGSVSPNNPNLMPLYTMDDMKPVTEKVGRIVLATDANHRRDDKDWHNHKGKTNVCLYTDSSVARKELLDGDFRNTRKLFFWLDKR